MKFGSGKPEPTSIKNSTKSTSMKNYIVELVMTSKTDGYYAVVIEGERHLNRTKIISSIQYFTLVGGYDYNHPRRVAEQNARAIANGLNQLEKIKANLCKL
jgi:hypothetical protein